AALSEKTITKTVRFAGREFQVEEKVSAERFAALEKTQKKNVEVKGNLQALDALDKALTNAASINSVQKSRADWSQFKEKAGIEEELKRGRGYAAAAAAAAAATAATAAAATVAAAAAKAVAAVAVVVAAAEATVAAIALELA
ncbi:hypothetical protein, conserved, partial [Eimeria necatrix]